MRHSRRFRRSRPRSRVDSNGPLRHAVYVSEGVVRSPDPAAAAARERLALAVVAARERLDVTQEEFAERGGEGLSLKTLQRVELRRVKPTIRSFNGLDRAAGWVPGSARLLYEQGKEPIEIRRVADSAANGRPVGLLETWTDEEIERVRGMTPKAIYEEGASIGRFAGEDAEFRYLHDVALIRLAKRASVPVERDAAP